MKKSKLLFSLILLCGMILSFSLVSFCDWGTLLDTTLTPTVADYADILSDDYEKELTDTMDILKIKYKMDFVFLSVKDYKSVNFVSGNSFRDFVCNYYDYLGFGYDDGEYSGIIFAVDMYSRSYQIVTTGKAMDVFDGTINTLTNRVQAKLSADDYQGACQAFVRNCNMKLSIGHYLPGLLTIVIALGAGIIIAIIVVVSLKNKNKTVSKGIFATEYIIESSYKLRHRSDVFVGEHTTRTYVPRSNGNGGGGSRGGGGSSGRSHGGGGGRF